MKNGRQIESTEMERVEPAQTTATADSADSTDRSKANAEIIALRGN